VSTLRQRVHDHTPWLAQQTPGSRWYFVAVMVLGLGAGISSLYDDRWRQIAWGGVVGWAGLAILVSFSIGLQLRRIAEGAGTVTLRDVWSLSALLIWGLPAALVVNLVVVIWSESVTKIRLEGRSFVLARCGFNAAFTTIALVAAAAVLRAGSDQWPTWFLAGVTFEFITVVAVDLHLIANRDRRRISRSLIVLVSMCLTEVPLASVLEVTWRHDPLLAAIMALPIFVTAAGLQYILEFIELRDLVSTDSRTGLLTPAAWREGTERLVRTRQAAILMADLDDFKQLNDNFGHLTGDEVLKQVGEVLTSSIRPGDLACRWGGDEFALMLAGTSIRDAALVAERIRSRIVTEAGIGEARTTISIGVAGCAQMPPAQAPQALTTTMVLADDALYRAKRGGRNRVSVMEPAHRSEGA
jgi:diguanylate cyclase (GGDEF)-like protein